MNPSRHFTVPSSRSFSFLLSSTNLSRHRSPYFSVSSSLQPPGLPTSPFPISLSTSPSFSQMAPNTLLKHRTRAERRPDPEDSIDSITCCVCGSGEADAELLLCDDCDGGYHTFCLRPILPRVPSGAWFCPSCSSSSSFGKKVPRSMRDFIFFSTSFLYFCNISRVCANKWYSLRLWTEFYLVGLKDPFFLVSS